MLFVIGLRRGFSVRSVAVGTGGLDGGGMGGIAEGELLGLLIEDNNSRTVATGEESLCQ